MTWRVPPYDRAIGELEAYVREAFSPRGILVAGSIVRGEAGPTSDFDVFVIHDESWRVREQRWFAGVPAELFVNPPAQIRRYFASEHEDGRPATAHMFATGEPLPPVDPIVEALVREGRDWLARAVELSPAKLTAMRYGAVDLLDDARDVFDVDRASACLLLGHAVQSIIEYAFWRAGQFQPRRKRTVEALAAIDGEAAVLVRRWATDAGPGSRDALAIVEALAQRVLGVDRFFAWSSERETVAIDSP